MRPALGSVSVPLDEVKEDFDRLLLSTGGVFCRKYFLDLDFPHSLSIYCLPRYDITKRFEVFSGTKQTMAISDIIALVNKGLNLVSLNKSAREESRSLKFAFLRGMERVESNSFLIYSLRKIEASDSKKGLKSSRCKFFYYYGPVQPPPPPTVPVRRTPSESIPPLPRILSIQETVARITPSAPTSYIQPPLIFPPPLMFRRDSRPPSQIPPLLNPPLPHSTIPPPPVRDSIRRPSETTSTASSVSVDSLSWTCPHRIIHVEPTTPVGPEDILAIYFRASSPRPLECSFGVSFGTSRVYGHAPEGSYGIFRVEDPRPCIGTVFGSNVCLRVRLPPLQPFLPISNLATSFDLHVTCNSPVAGSRTVTRKAAFLYHSPVYWMPSRKVLHRLRRAYRHLQLTVVGISPSVDVEEGQDVDVEVTLRFDPPRTLSDPQAQATPLCPVVLPTNCLLQVWFDSILLPTPSVLPVRAPPPLGRPNHLSLQIRVHCPSVSVLLSQVGVDSRSESQLLRSVVRRVRVELVSIEKATLTLRKLLVVRRPDSPLPPPPPPPPVAAPEDRCLLVGSDLFCSFLKDCFGQVQSPVFCFESIRKANLLYYLRQYLNRVDSWNFDILIHAAARGLQWLCARCFEVGFDVFRVDVFQNSALHYACLFGEKDVMAVLLKEAEERNLARSRNILGMDPTRMKEVFEIMGTRRGQSGSKRKIGEVQESTTGGEENEGHEPPTKRIRSG